MQPSTTKDWHIAEQIPPDVDRALQRFPPLLRQILHNRSYDSEDEALKYLEARPPQGNQPENLLGLAAAVDRIRHAIRHQERIAIYGDYDADGVTAAALLTQALRRLEADVRPYIPNRFDEGYGLNNEALDVLRDEGVRLVITVDCGMRSNREAEHAREIGLDLIITDHHTPGVEELPAIAVINPKQPGDAYPDKNLAGVGIAYKLACALLGETEGVGAEEFLDLVALGTVTDLASLTGENRFLVREGIKWLRQPRRQGVYSLINVAQVAAQQITAEAISFILGPRLNAAGRLDSAMAALELLLATEISEAAGLAQILDNHNRERQQLTRQIQTQAEQIALEKDPQALLLFAVDESFNPGVVGLAASRLTEQYYRPAIVAHRGDEFTRGSCRSIPEFHITQALDRCADLLVRHGGHSAAAGFTVRNEHLDELKQRLVEIAQEQLGQQDLRPRLKADAVVPLSEMRPDLLPMLAWLQPTGIGNPPAVFVSQNLKVLRSKTVGKDGAHLKLTVSDGRITYDAIAFRQGHWQANMPAYVDLMYQLEVNEYNGQRVLQLNVRDLKPSQ